MYKCKKCNKPVLVIENQEPIRTCDCKKEDGSKESIITEVEVLIKGKGKLN